MSTSGVLNPDWLNVNSQRRYPLYEEASGRDASGGFRLPDDFLVDAQVPVHADPALDVGLFHVSAVGVFGAGVTLELAYAGVPFASLTIDAASFRRNRTYLLQGRNRFFDTVARVTVGTLDTVLRSPGYFLFDVEGGRLEPAVIRTGLRGVDAIWLRSGQDVLGPLQGDVFLEAGRNFQASFVEGDGTETAPDRIRLDAVDGAGLGADCPCGPSARPPIRTVNGQGPKPDGDLPLRGSDCVEVADPNPRDGGLRSADGGRRRRHAGQPSPRLR